MRHYIAIIDRSAEGTFGVTFPDFPGCVTTGDSLEEAKALAAEALALHLEGMREDGDPIPDPMSLDEAKEHEFAAGAQAFLLVEAPGLDEPVVRVNITAPKSTLERIDRYAEGRGLTRSAFLIQSARQAMQRGA